MPSPSCQNMKCDDECKMAWRMVKNFCLLYLHGEIASGVEGAVMRELIFFPPLVPVTRGGTNMWQFSVCRMNEVMLGSSRCSCGSFRK